MGESKIIVVANQKGGVGKSTVCMALANYLALEQSCCVGGIIDTDPQQSVKKRRKSDKEQSEGTPVCSPYEVTEFNLNNYQRIPELIEALRKKGMPYIFDTPGNMKHQGLVSLLALADYIIVPFNYDALVLASTVQFLIFWNNLKVSYEKSNNGETIKAKLIFVPTMINPRIGTAAERALWENIKVEYAKYGPIAPRINFRADLKRCTTLSLPDEQKTAVQDALYFIYETIYKPKPQNNEESDGEEDTEY